MQITEISATKLPDIGIKRVAAYARVSSEKGEALHSLSAQISYYNECISNHIGWEFVGVYADAPDIIGLKQNPTKRVSL
jgi:site-specific DNA recombinase